MKASAGFLVGPWMEQGLFAKTLSWTGLMGTSRMDERNYKLLQNSSIFSHSLFQVQIASLQNVKTLHRIKDKKNSIFMVFLAYISFSRLQLAWTGATMLVTLQTQKGITKRDNS